MHVFSHIGKAFSNYSLAQFFHEPAGQAQGVSPRTPMAAEDTGHTRGADATLALTLPSDDPSLLPPSVSNCAPSFGLLTGPHVPAVTIQPPCGRQNVRQQPSLTPACLDASPDLRHPFSGLGPPLPPPHWLPASDWAYAGPESRYSPWTSPCPLQRQVLCIATALPAWIPIFPHLCKVEFLSLPVPALQPRRAPLGRISLWKS